MQPINPMQAAVGAGLAIIWAPSCPLDRVTKIFITAVGALLTIAPSIPFQRPSEIATSLPRWKELLSAYIENPQRPTGGSGTMRDLTRHVLPAACNIVGKIFHQHVPGEPILELGSHVLNDKGQSYLAELVPEEYLPHFTYSDSDVAFIASEGGKTCQNYRLLDATTLTDIGPILPTTVVALNVFDTIAREKLPVAARALSRVLKPGGKVVILSDLPFHQSPFIQKYAVEGRVIIPHQEENFLGVKSVSIDALLTHAKAHGDDFLRFIQELALKPSQERAHFLFSMFQHGENLCRILSTICPPECYEAIDHKDSYIHDLQAAFKGFEIVEQGYKETTVRLEGTIQGEPRINSLTADVRIAGALIGRNRSQIPENQIELSSVFHLLVAKVV